MKKPGYLLKAVTVTSSVLLVAGYISYRAGAFDRLVGSAEPERFQAGCSFVVSPKDVPQQAPAFMRSSKSIILVDPPTVKDGKRTTNADPAFMSGSKYIILIDPAKSKVTPPVSPNSETFP